MSHEDTIERTIEEVRDALAPRYKVVREIGHGGMATVYLATAEDGTEVAVKLISAHVVNAMGGADRFRREVEIASNVDHPNILRAFDSGGHGDTLYFVMKYVRGESLRDRLVNDRQLAVDEAVRIVQEIGAALQYAHARGFIHRDIKPENVMIEEDGHVLVADFGVARVVSAAGDASTLTRTGVAVGTPAYMSPEQGAADKMVDGRSDQYALGCLLYELLVGEPPFHGQTMMMLMARHALEPVPSVRIVRDTVPEHVEDAIYRALAKSPADRFPTMDAFVRALGTPGDWRFVEAARGGKRRVARKGSWWRREPRTRVAMAAAAMLVVMAGGGVFAWSRRSPTADAAPSTVTIAVAPFTARDPNLGLWREGMVDLLARNLDGAGPLRAVAPAVVMRGWTGDADHDGSRALAARTGAEYAVFGEVTATPTGVHLKGQLVDVQADHGDDYQYDAAEVSALADSLAMFVVDRLGKKFQFSAAHASPLGRVPIAALKPFLEGEQAYRRTAWVPALAAYQRAIAADANFALAYRRAGQVVVWQRDNADSLARAYTLHAGALNQGHAPRDSLLLQADSLAAAISAGTSELPDWNIVRRLFATVNDAAARYPDDPEVWYTVGEARFHHGYGQPAGNVTESSVLDAFSRAITLDSGFAPAYIHAVELAFTLQGRAAGRRYAEAYLRLDPTDAQARAIAIVEALTDSAGAGTPAAARLLDTSSTDALAGAMFALRRWPDRDATALTILRAIGRRPASSSTHAADSAFVRTYLPLALAYRGRFRDAYAASGPSRARLFSELAVLDAVPRDSAAAAFARWLGAASPGAVRALPWWASVGDSAAIGRLARQQDSLVRAGPPERRAAATYGREAARAYLLLLRGGAADTTQALATFQRLSDTLCLDCYMDRLSAARAFASRGRTAESSALLGQRLYAIITPIEVSLALERGRLALRAGRRDEALSAFTLVADAWERGDAETRPAVDEARKALATLGRPRTVAAAR